MGRRGEREANQRRALAGWQRFADSRAAGLVALAWGFAEATLFFIVPDIWIGLLALCDWRAGLRAAAWAVAGAVLGGAVMYGVGARTAPERSAALLEAVPAVSPAMVARVEDEMRDGGPASMLLGPLRGTPYKLYVRAAGVADESLLATLLWTVPARAGRFLLVALVTALCGMAVRRFSDDWRWLVWPYLVAWAIFYAVYFWALGL